MQKHELKISGSLAKKINCLLTDGQKKSLALQKEPGREYFLVLQPGGNYPDVVSIELRQNGQPVFAVTGPELQKLRSEFE